MNDLYHGAARDSVIEILKTATKRDANRRDEDGMTSIHYAASCGNVEALRVLVGKGGDPDKPTHDGTTAVHLAASCGQLNCLSYLTNFGSNIWALNNDGRTPLEEAALHNHMDCVRHLDGLVAVQKIQNKKKVDRLQLQAQKDVAKRIRKEEKVKAQREKVYERRVSREVKERSISSVNSQSHRGIPASIGNSNEWTHNQRNGTLRNTQERPFSELAGVIYDDNKQDLVETRSGRSYSDTITSKSTFLGTIRSKFSTLRGKNAEIATEPKLIRKRYVDSDLHSFHSHSVPSGLDSLDSEAVQDPHVSHGAPSPPQTDITYDASQEYGQMIKSVDSKGNVSTSIQYVPNKSPRMRNGSIASRLSHRSHFSYSTSDLLSVNGLTDLEDSFSEVVFESLEVKCLVSFLSSLNLEQFSIPLIKESIDLSSLSLLSDEDLQGIGLPLGPRRKILEAMKRRDAVLEHPGLLRDSKI